MKTKKAIKYNCGHDGKPSQDHLHEKEDHGRSQAKAQLESITEMVAELNSSRENKRIEGGVTADNRYDNAVQAITDDALEMEIRSEWHMPGQTDVRAGEFYILLCTGGPAVRIIGTLSGHAEPESARLEYQDWGTPWTEYRLTSEEGETVLTYCRCFYFGE